MFCIAEQRAVLAGLGLVRRAQQQVKRPFILTGLQFREICRNALQNERTSNLQFRDDFHRTLTELGRSFKLKTAQIFGEIGPK